jgi:hypothetical protein
MAVYHVVPDADGDTQRYGWKVTKVNVGRKSNHTKKTAARREAKRLASKGDSIIIHRKNGQVQRSISV